VSYQSDALQKASLAAQGAASEIDDPFAGLLGQGSARDDLWLGKAVPRYTSYPPATAFQENVTAADYRAVLAEIPTEEPISLYMHVPFCRSLCLYCGCHAVPTQQHDRVSSYLDTLQRELEHVALTSSRSRRIGRVHFGGGSPNILSEKDMGALFGAMARRFDMSGCQEIAMEIDPRLVTLAQVRAMRMTGVSRVSLGVQDFDLEVQEAIGRVQPYEMIASVYNMLRDQGIKGINFDLMYGLPFQSPVTMAETARQVIALRPDRIALFSYAHVPQVKKQQKVLEQYVLPGPYASLALERAARAVFVEAGYVEIGMDHFALPEDSLARAASRGALHRNFQGYTDDNASTMLGLGASGIGRTLNRFFQNTRDIEDYQKKVASDGFATTRGIGLSGEDRLRAAIIESLMCNMSVDLEAVCRSFNYALSSFGAEIEALEVYEKAGIIRRENYKITLAVPHRMAVRVIAAVFDKTRRAADAPVSRVS